MALPQLHSHIPGQLPVRSLGKGIKAALPSHFPVLVLIFQRSKYFNTAALSISSHSSCFLAGAEHKVPESGGLRLLKEKGQAADGDPTK